MEQPILCFDKKTQITHAPIDKMHDGVVPAQEKDGNESEDGENPESSE